MKVKTKPGQMKRPRKTLSDYFAIAPWWISILIASFAYVFLRYVLPPLLDDQEIEGSAAIIRFLAPYIALLLLVPLPFALFHRDEHRQLVESERRLDALRDLDLEEFVNIIAEGYRRQGYDVEDLSGTGASAKLDLMLRRGGEKTIVVCKQWRARCISAKLPRSVQALQASYGAAGSHLVTCGVFAPAARRFARLSSTELIDGSNVLKLTGLTDQQASRM